MQSSSDGDGTAKGGDEASPISTLIWKSSSDPAIHHFFLDLVDSDGANATFESTSERCAIGSARSNDIVLDDPTVSRFHSEVHVEGGAARVRDMESRNGTILDGVVVRDAYLRAGSILQLGRVALRFRPSEKRTVVPLSTRGELGTLVGRSPAMRACFAVLERVAVSNAVLLLEGETGTGKSQAARAVHRLSARSGGPFITVDCGAIPGNLVESELFGHRRGAFTGAFEDRAGVFEAGHGGTVFLDEVGELPLDVQPKLLKALEDREVRRIGTNDYRPIDVRIVAASNRDLRAEVNAGRFRPDLYYRLAVVRLALPPLRQRPEDVGAIAERLLEGLGASAEVRKALLSASFVARLQAASWPGNVRELRNHLERCLVFEDALQPGTEAIEAVASLIDAGLPYTEARRRAIEAFERSYVEALVERFGGNVTHAAESAELDRAYVYRLLRKFKKD